MMIPVGKADAGWVARTMVPNVEICGAKSFAWQLSGTRVSPPRIPPPSRTRGLERLEIIAVQFNTVNFLSPKRGHGDVDGRIQLEFPLTTRQPNTGNSAFISPQKPAPKSQACPSSARAPVSPTSKGNIRRSNSDRPR